MERDSTRAATVNGRREPPPLVLVAGTTYRLRFANILFAPAARVTLAADSVPLAWIPVAKDGADLPPAWRSRGPARLRRIGPGETYDFLWTPDRPANAVLEVWTPEGIVRQTVRVLPAGVASAAVVHTAVPIHPSHAGR